MCALFKDGWIKEANLVASFHEEKIKSQGSYVNNGKGQKIGWSIRDTAIALGKSPTTVSRLIKLSKGLKEYPFLKNYSSILEAEQALKTMENSIKVRR